MVNVDIIRDSDGLIRQIIIEGHAGFNEEGLDIVCAAVSVTAYTAVGALGDLAGIPDCFTEEHGFMLISLPEEIPEEKRQTIKVILETTAIGFKQIESAYKEYVSVLDEEV